jgi:hypothetical protein
MRNSFKNNLIFLALLSLVINCSDDSEKSDPSLNGRWQLKAILSDPGDGSGTFQSVDSDKYIEFLPNLEVRSNGNLCNGGTSSDDPSFGVYALPDSILHIDECPQDILSTRFRIEKGKLILSYPCIEPCEEKYVKLE